MGQAEHEIITYDARNILKMASCQSGTAVERMAHRWYLEPGDPPSGRPDILLAPRFSPVPPLRITVPDHDTALDVEVTGWSPYGWFSHLRVSFPGADVPVTVSDPVFSGRPGSAEQMRKSGRSQLWRGYVATLPPGASYIEVSKGEEMEAALVAVTFRQCLTPETRHLSRQPADKPLVIGITDMGLLAGDTLQAYDWQAVTDFYRQMAGMGFTHLFQQVYGGSASWSSLARPHQIVPYGHKQYANWAEPARPAYFIGHDNTDGFQQDIDTIHTAGMKMVASFRINNEWLADWARNHADWPDGIPPFASQFSVDHPEFQMMYKSGTGSGGGGLDFSFPEVRDYRRDIIIQWCDTFHTFDGICIDTHRHPGMVAYPQHLVDRFKAQTGIDVRTVEPIDEHTILPEWLALKAECFTEFMRAVRLVLQNRYAGAMPLSVRVGNTFEQAMLEGCDLAAWIREKLVDLLILQHREPANPQDADSRPIIEAAHKNGIRVVHLYGGWGGVDFPNDDLAPVRPRIETWRQWGSDGFGFYEAERIGQDGRWIKEMPDIVGSWRNG